MAKSILFLYGDDFKSKSIQVIKKTPEEYAKHGWEVDCIVYRDCSKYGNYFYEDIVDPKGVNVFRFNWPLNTFRNKIKNKYFRSLLNKVASYGVVLGLILKANKLRKSKQYNVIYGYELFGILALPFVNCFKDAIKIKRYQGTWLYHYYIEKNYKKLLMNLDRIISFKIFSDLCLMTNDGTRGDLAQTLFGRKKSGRFEFLINGVDVQKKHDDSFVREIESKYKTNDAHTFLSLSRLNDWKHVERIFFTLKRFKETHPDVRFNYFVIGDGPEKSDLMKLRKQLGLENEIHFVGAVDNETALKYMSYADYFFSMYDLSNVGNPLLEAIRYNKIIFTLDNGDTSRWIQHGKNGFIYKLNTQLYDNIVSDLYMCITNEEYREIVISQIKIVDQEKLWTWDERLSYEERLVTSICKY